MMVSNMSESDESRNDVDIDEEVIVPQPHHYSIWDCPHVNKFTLEENGVVKNGWRCNWCMIPQTIFSSFSATKALAHVLQLPGNDVRPCSGIIPETFALGYKDLYTRKIEAGCSRSDNKNSMTDSIENIQERTAGAIMTAVSAGVCLAAASASASKHGVLVKVYSITLSPPPAVLQTIVLIQFHLALNPQEILFGGTTNLLPWYVFSCPPPKVVALAALAPLIHVRQRDQGLVG